MAQNGIVLQPPLIVVIIIPNDMAKLTKEYRLIFDYNNIIQNAENYKDKVTGTMEFYDTFFQGKEFDTIGEMQKFIKQNKLIVKTDEGTEINPFDSEWNPEKPDAKIRMYINSYNAALLAIDIPTFPVYLYEKGITLIPDANYDVVWAYLESIDEQDKTLLENERYNAKFQYR